jgi:hypothetical protein
MDDDIDDLIVLGGSVGDAAVPDLDSDVLCLVALSNQGVPPSTDASTVAERDVQDLLELVELGEGAKAKDKDTVKRRSWELMKLARTTKDIKRMRKTCDDLSTANEALSQALVSLSHLHPVVARALKKYGKKVQPDDAKAAAISFIGFAPSIKGNLPGRHLQARASSALAHCALQQQREWLLKENGLWVTSPCDAERPLGDIAPPKTLESCVGNGTRLHNACVEFSAEIQ